MTSVCCLATLLLALAPLSALAVPISTTATATQVSLPAHMGDRTALDGPVPQRFARILDALAANSSSSSAGVSNAASRSPGCISALAVSLQESCSLADSALRDAAFQHGSARASSMCINTVQYTDAGFAKPQGVQLIVPTDIYAELLLQAAVFKQQTGIEVRLTAIQMTQVVPLALFELQNNLTTAHDGWISQLSTTVQLLLAGYIARLAPFQAQDALYGDYLQWEDVPEYFQAVAVDTPVGSMLPLDNPIAVFYFRTDLLQGSPPRTWSEVLFLAQQYNGTDLNGDGHPDYGICLERDADCSYQSVARLIIAPYIQYNGTSQGLLFDPPTMVPLFGNAGVVTALTLLRQLQLLSPNAENVSPAGTCAPLGSGLFLQGRCAMTIGDGSLFKVVELNREPKLMRANLGVTLMPGSEEVWDRVAAAVVPCTLETCMYGANGTVEVITRMQDNTTVVVNRVTDFEATQLAGAVSALVAPTQQAGAYQFLTFLGSAAVSLAIASSNTSLLLPFRTSLLSAASVPGYVAAGYSEDATQQFLATMRENLDTNNVVKLHGIRHIDVVVRMYVIAAANLTAGVPPAVIAEAMQVMVLTGIIHANSSPAYTAELNASYWEAIGYVPPNNTSPAPPRFPIAPLPKVSIAVPIVASVLALLLASFHELRKHRKHKDLLGKVVAPGPFADTTLLITDIQDSTSLWEALPSWVMDRAIKEHHRCIRQLLAKLSGYESATEGDSFILAFHCSEDALLFAMEAQVALIECDWPQELLEHPECRPFYAVPLAAKEELLRRQNTEAALLRSGRIAAAALTSVTTDSTLLRTASFADQAMLVRTGSIDVSALRAAEAAAGLTFHNSAGAHDHIMVRGLSLDGTGMLDMSGYVRGSTTGSSALQLSPRQLSPRQVSPVRHQVTGASALLALVGLGNATNTGRSAAGTGSGNEEGSLASDSQAIHNLPVGQACTTFAESCHKSWPECDSTDPRCVLLYSGLRVRMGLHSGVSSDSDVAYNKASGRMQYSGEILSAAKAVSDAAVGGMVLLDASTYKTLPMERLWDKAMVVHMGEHYLTADHRATVDLYQVMGRRLMGRLGHLGPMRHSGEVMAGVLSAPLGSLAVAYLTVVGAATLLSWDAPAARLGLAVVRHEALLAMRRYGGYLAESSEDQVMVVFQRPGDAVLWALETHQELLLHAWPRGLLDHELCEELCVGDTVMFRGPRIKIGIDLGDAVGEVNAMTGRICYRGKAVARARGIVLAAASNQVLAASAAWAGATRGEQGSRLLAQRVVADRIGTFKLKGRGPADRVELMHCRSYAPRMSQTTMPLPLPHLSVGWPGGAPHGADAFAASSRGSRGSRQDGLPELPFVHPPSPTVGGASSSRLSSAPLLMLRPHSSKRLISASFELAVPPASRWKPAARFAPRSRSTHQLVLDPAFLAHPTAGGGAGPSTTSHQQPPELSFGIAPAARLSHGGGGSIIRSGRSLTHLLTPPPHPLLAGQLSPRQHSPLSGESCSRGTISGMLSPLGTRGASSRGAPAGGSGGSGGVWSPERDTVGGGGLRRREDPAPRRSYNGTFPPTALRPPAGRQHPHLLPHA